ncbi:MAG: glycosyltransferase family 9 protein, partial [Bacteroidales bacterium]|nr:glycosyltransferase family 9 protein [Bacteroidales bacterium]
SSSRIYMKVKNYKRIIISRTDSIGDVVLTLPLAGKLKALMPDTEIVFLGKSYTQPIIQSCIHVDRFVNWDVVSGHSKPERAAFLKEIDADVIIFAFPQKEVCFAAKTAKIPVRIATAGRLTTLQTCNKLVPFSRKNSSLHESQLNMFLLRPVGVEAIPSMDEILQLIGWKSPRLNNERLKTLLDDPRKKIILHPKSKGSAPEWPIERFASLAHQLSPEDFLIFVTGTPEDRKLISDIFPFQLENIIDLCGSISLSEFIAFIAHCDTMIASSTGPIHIAAVSSILTIGLFSPIRPFHPARWKPIGARVEIITAENHPLKGKELDIPVSEVSNILQTKLLYL